MVRPLLAGRPAGRPLDALIAVALVVLAGCSGAGSPALAPSGATATATVGTPSPTGQETTSDPPTPTGAPTPTGTATPAATATPTPTPTETTTPEPDASALTVSLTDATGSAREFGPVVAAAVAYWTDERVERFAAYDAELVYVGSAAEGDVEVRVADELGGCTDDGDEEPLGCAPVLDGPPASPVTVEVRSGQTDAELETTLEHELGHVLGIAHDEPPTWLMAGRSRVSPPGSVPNATEREHPWNHSGDIRVAVHGEMAGAATVESNVRAAAVFYNRRAGRYLPNDTRIVLVDEWYRADVVFHDEPPGSVAPVDGSRSIAYPSGLDYDSDPALEQWEDATVYLANVDPAEAEPHAGFWLGVLAGNSPDELPARYANG